MQMSIDCGNSYGISLLVIAGRIITWVLLTWLLQYIVDVLPGILCGFCLRCSIVNMIFIANLIQKKSCKQHCDLHLIFIDLTKAFDTITWEILWEVLQELRCLPIFLCIKDFHDDISAYVLWCMVPQIWDSFPWGLQSNRVEYWPLCFSMISRHV